MGTDQLIGLRVCILTQIVAKILIHRIEKWSRTPMFYTTPHHPIANPSPPLFLFLGRGERENALQYIKVLAVLDPTFSDEIPFCLFFK